MFTKQCFIKKNSKGLREKLNSLGYKLNHGKAWGKYLCVFKTEDTKEFFYVASPYWDLKNMPDFGNSIDCGENEDLFLAIAALRDDSDYMQYFVNNKSNEWYCHRPLTEYGNSNDAFEIIRKDRWHKATVKELIEHFKIA